MPLQCNINSKGKAIRLVLGSVIVVAGIALLLLEGYSSHSQLLWRLSVGMILGGAFMIFEGAAGWCVIRAIGLRTRF